MLLICYLYGEIITSIRPVLIIYAFTYNLGSPQNLTPQYTIKVLICQDFFWLRNGQRLQGNVYHLLVAFVPFLNQTFIRSSLNSQIGANKVQCHVSQHPCERSPQLKEWAHTRTLPRLVSKEVLAMMTEMARETSLKNKHLRNCDYFAIIPSCSHFTMLKKNPANGLV